MPSMLSSLSERYRYFQWLQTLALIGLLLSAPLTKAALPAFDSQGKNVPTLAPMLKRVNPAVVNIATYSTTQYTNNPLLNDPFFRRFFNLPDAREYQRQAPKKRQQSAGSGVIVDASKGKGTGLAIYKRIRKK